MQFLPSHRHYFEAVEYANQLKVLAKFRKLKSWGKIKKRDQLEINFHFGIRAIYHFNQITVKLSPS